MALFKGSKVDLTINVEREKLIDILQSNRTKHMQEFQLAMEGYRKELVRLAEENLERAKKGEYPNMLHDQKPRDYSAQYTRALGMLEMSNDKNIALSAYDYARFVEDDWDWKASFTSNVASYRRD
jgi:hypothetical protein